MEFDDIRNLREWSPLTGLLANIPTRIQKNLFFHDLSITCMDILAEFIALGSDAGIVFWHNRKTENVQKLRSEFNSTITCVRIVSSVEYLIAAGNADGQVSVFQIPKPHPPELSLIAPWTKKTKPIERYTIRDLHQTPIRCVEWSKNGMKLFSGDQQGIVVLTEFDFQTHTSKSLEILNEAYDIVQIYFQNQLLLISTVYRAIVCAKDPDTVKWRVLQIGKKDRKMLSEFGVAFMTVRSTVESEQQTPNNNKIPSIICGRPGFRFWVADADGNVSQTLSLKEAVSEKNIFEIPLLNPGRLNVTVPINFGPCHVYRQRYLVTHSNNIIYILNLEKLKIEGRIRRLRNIVSLAIFDAEIFILEGARSVIRIAPMPDLIQNIKIYSNPEANLAKPQNPIVEFECAEERASAAAAPVVNAEECFELPPIECLGEIEPLRVSYSEHNLLQQDKLLLEHSKKGEVYEKINNLDFDDSILFKKNLKKKKTKERREETIGGSKGIVEIGQQVGGDIVDKVVKNKSEIRPEGKTTKPSLLDVSYCAEESQSSIAPDLRSPDTINKMLKPKEQQLAAMLNIETILPPPEKSSQSIHKHEIIESQFNYSINYPSVCNEMASSSAHHTTPIRKMHFLKDDDDVDGGKFRNLSDDVKNVLQLNVCHTNESEATTSNELPAVKKWPDYMKLPNLWNVTIEKTNGANTAPPPPTQQQRSSSDGSGSSGCSDWEFIN